MEKRKSNKKFFTPRTVARGLETLDAYSKRQANKEAARNADERARRERFRVSCEKGRRFLVNEQVLEHWLKQVEIALSGPQKYWGDTKKFSWPKDKAIIYAVMMICVENTGGAIRVIPDSLRQTRYYKINEYVWTWVENFDLAVEFMDYIEAELKAEGLIGNSTKPPAKDKRPNDLITLAIAIQDFHVSRKTLKEEIYAGNIKSYRESEKEMHQVSRAKLEQKYLQKKS